MFTVHDVPDPAVIKVYLATPVPVTCMPIATVPDTKVLIVRVVPTMVPVKMACVAAPVLKAHVFVIVVKELLTRSPPTINRLFTGLYAKHLAVKNKLVELKLVQVTPSVE